MSAVTEDNTRLPDHSGYPTFIVSIFGVVTALNKNMFELFTTSTANRVFIHSLVMTNEQTNTVTGVVATYEIARSVAPAAGSTLQPIVPLTSNLTLPPLVIASTGGTSTSVVVYSRELRSTDEWVPNGADAESLTVPILDNKNLTDAFSLGRPVTLNTNEGITVRCLTNTATGLNGFKCIFSVGP